ncbi:glycerophosphodiester phosphodiesterase family protein [Halovulum sp. GXIMD14793]
MSLRRKLLLTLLVLASCLYLWNASWLAPASQQEARLLAHRGVHTLFSREGLDAKTCTAAQSLPPVSPFIENTIPSMKAAFDAGADVVELDIQLTADGRFAVFHDWTLNCRTDGAGVTREQTLAQLQSLDIGYGYRVDGDVFPLRGKGIGLMPSLAEVMTAFPDGRFLIDLKSNDRNEGEALAKALSDHPDWRDRVWGVYGGEKPVQAVTAAVPGMRGLSKPALKSCLKQYVALGWSGYVPGPCRNAIVMVPANYGVWLWGWPNRFVARMEKAGSVVILRGPMEGSFATGIDTPDQAASYNDFPGLIWTNDILTIAPLIRR